MVHKKRLSLTAASGLIVELLNKVAPLIILHIAQQRLGIEGFGYAMYGISIIELFIPFVVFGYNHLGTVQISKWERNKNKVSQLISDMVFLRLIHSALVIALLYYLSSSIESYIPYQKLILYLSFAFVFSSFELIWVHLAVQKMIRINFFIAAGRFLSLFLILYFVEDKSHATLFAILMLASNALINLFTAIDGYAMFPFKKPSIKRMCKIFQQSYFFAVILALSTFLERWDILVVENFEGAIGAGFYSGPARIGHSLYQVANAIVLTFFSEMVSLKDKKLISKHMDLSIWAISFFLSPVLFGIWFVSGDILALVFDDSFRKMGLLLVIMVFSTCLSLALSAFGLQILVAGGKEKKFVAGLVLAAILACFASIKLHSSYGLEGIACGMIAGKILGLLFILKWSKGILGYLPLKPLLLGMVPAIFMFFVLFFAKLENLPMNLILGSSSFLFMSLLLYKKQVLRIINIVRAREHKNN